LEQYKLLQLIFSKAPTLKRFMSSIFYVHDHPNKPKQHPILRTLYFIALLSVVAIPVLSSRVFAAGAGMSAAQLYIDGKTINVATEARTVRGVIEDAGYTINEKDQVEPALDTEIGDGYKINVYRALPVTIQDQNANLELETAHKTPEAIATEAGLEVHPEDKLSLTTSNLDTNELKPGLTLKIDRATIINLNLYGQISQARTQTATVEDFLKEKQIQLQPGDVLVEDPNQTLAENSTVTIRNDAKEVVTVDEEIAMPEEKIQDVNKDTSYRQVQTAGSAGSKKVTYEIKKENGQEVSRMVLEEVVTKPAVKQVVVVGSKKIVSSKVSGSSQDWLVAAGIAESDWGYVDHIIGKESGWNYTSRNRSSGAYGLCQALPGNKMASAGSDWQTNPVTQLRWCNSYANSRYGSWAAAYSFWQSRHWW
jgi:uncharacterized protein YabE (DUF348 family)